MNTNGKAATKILVEWDDGSKTVATGEHADEVMNWWNSCETFCYVHGMYFKGHPMTEVAPLPKPKSPERDEEAPENLR